MAHFAKISEDNIVLQVLTLNDSDMLDQNRNSSELIGQQYLEKHNNWPAHLWIQTSYNTSNNIHKLGGTPFRGNYAGIGYTWDSLKNIFYRPKPFPSWILNLQKADWESPIGNSPVLTEEQKQNKQFYIWNENNQSWDLTSYF
jgi:hypothetical protein